MSRLTRAGAAAREIVHARANPHIKAEPPPRDDDPFAKKTGRRLTYYTPEFLAEAKRRIETTKQSTNSIALDLGTSRDTLWRLVRRYGWVRPAGSLRLRGLSPAMRLAAAADELAGAAPPPEGGRSTAQRSGGGESRSEDHPTPALTGAGADPPPQGEGETEHAAMASPDDSAIARLEAAVLKELATVETMRASLRDEPLRPADAERTARTLSVLTETLAKLRRLRLAAQPQPDMADDTLDIDDFRRDLARRIDAFVESRADGGGAHRDPVTALDAPVA
jgi:hypothetical protein